MSTDTALILEKLASLRDTFAEMVTPCEKIDGALAAAAQAAPALAKAYGISSVQPLAPSMRFCADTLAKMHLMLTPAANSRAAEMSGFRPVAKGHEDRAASPSAPADVAAYLAGLDPDARTTLFAKLAKADLS